MSEAADAVPTPCAAESAGDLGALARAAAKRAVARLPGGLALVFAIDADRNPALRLLAATGIAGEDAARSASQALAPALQGVLEDRKARLLAAPRALGPAAGGGVLAVPLVWRGRRHGALVAAAPGAIGSEVRREIERLAGRLAERVDHDRLAARADALEARLRQHDDLSERKGEEILKLSEALFAQDIELLRKDEKLGKVERLKNDFIEKMSCELRTPLNGIIETIIAVLANEDTVLSEGTKSDLRAALDDGTAFLRTLQNILDLWRVKQGELAVEIGEVSFREVVDEAIFSVQDTLAGKEVLVEKRFGEPLPKIRTDLARVNQILFLLLDNAAKFTERGRIEIRAEVTGGELVCAVEDEGIGICPDDQQFVFDAFFQVDEPSASRFRGSGLGLALVRELVHLLGGSLALSSEVGRGSTFVFRIPVQTVA
ncbi:MAG: HAMP domain-containing histidine kinase [Deltaproteobacteria bacterium]|nr:HAMP domain-containing histidine kinase [Deltaproteobacteria bacterium]